jgi:hypothetical protein
MKNIAYFITDLPGGNGILSIDSGGTDATTAPEALTNLGAMPFMRLVVDLVLTDTTGIITATQNSAGTLRITDMFNSTLAGNWTVNGNVNTFVPVNSADTLENSWIIKVI